MRFQKEMAACYRCPFHNPEQITVFNENVRPKLEAALAALSCIRAGAILAGLPANWESHGFADQEKAIREALAVADRRIAEARAV